MGGPWLPRCSISASWNRGGGCSRVEARGSVGDHLGHILTCCLVWQGWGETRWECVLNAGPCRNPDCLFVIPMCTFCFTHMPSCTTYKTPTQTHFCEHTRTQIHVTHRHTPEGKCEEDGVVKLKQSKDTCLFKTWFLSVGTADKHLKLIYLMIILFVLFLKPWHYIV